MANARRGMQLSTESVLVLIFVSGLYLTCFAESDRDGRRYLNSLNNIERKDDPKPGNIANPFLKKFLDEHSRPEVKLKEKEDKTFVLSIDDRYNFKPDLKMAPFPSTGEPWPWPKTYRGGVDKILRLNKSMFKISVLNKSCHILTEAIERYKKIIKNHTIEEHYEFVFNYNEKTASDRKKNQGRKYEHVEPMPDLEIDMAEDECGYPHGDMKESYKLIVRSDMVRLTADQVWGVLRGLETFSQLLFRKRDTDEIYSRVTEIEDEPRFPHRGILMDTSRHYIQKYTIQNVLDGMAYNKMNVLHWHIVDDNSFPYQSEVFPKLSEKGAFHPDLIYKISDVKEVVEYARYRGIRVIPEFDTPGHTFSWLGYPEIKSTCYAGDSPVSGPMGPINPAKDETYVFMAKLFSEIFDVFPDSYVHLGGDELASRCWATNPSITAYLQQHGNIPAYEARSNAQNYINLAVGYYFKRLIETLRTTMRENQQKKSFIMWEDVLKNTKEVPTDSILQIWLGRQSNVLALNERGYRALYSTCWYLDNYRIHVQWTYHYKCEPSPYRTEEEEKGKLLGGEACLWGEYITTDTLMTFMWPGACPTAERLWSPKSTRDIVSAQRRLQEQRCRMIFRGLPVGHISGPDYCLRPRDGPLGGPDTSGENGDQDATNQMNGAARPEAQYAVKDGDQNVSVFVFSDYHSFLPVLNILLSMAGIYFIIFATSCWRRKGYYRICQRMV